MCLCGAPELGGGTTSVVDSRLTSAGYQHRKCTVSDRKHNWPGCSSHATPREVGQESHTCYRSRLVNRDRGGSGGLPERVGSVQRVRGDGAGGDGDRRATCCAYSRGHDDVRRAGDLPREGDRRAGRNGICAGDELRDLWCRAGWHICTGVERRDLDHIEIGSGDVPQIVQVIIAPAIVGSATDVHG